MMGFMLIVRRQSAVYTLWPAQKKQTMRPIPIFAGGEMLRMEGGQGRAQSQQLPDTYRIMGKNPRLIFLLR